MEKHTNSVGSPRLGSILGFAVAMALFAGLACSSSDVTVQVGIDFTVQRLDPQVFSGAASGSMSPLESSSPQSLSRGQRVSTDAAGQALLEGQLSVNKTCRIYLFHLSSLVTRACSKSNYEGSNTATCQEENTAAYKECKGNVQMTPSGEVQVVGSWLSITYLPDRQLTLVIVADGTAAVQPVTEFDSRTLGTPITVKAQQFLYTAPDAMLDEIAGLPPREPLPVTELLPLVQELEIEPWIDQAIDRSVQDDVPIEVEPGRLATPTTPPPPPTTPPPPPTTPPPPEEAFVVRGVGGALEDPRVQEAVAGAVDWTAAATRLPTNALPLKGPVASLVFPDWTTTTDQVVFDPEKSKALQDEAGYPSGFPILILLSEEDEDLLGVAKWIHGDLLTNLGLDTKYRVEPAENVQPLIEEFVAADVALLWVAWE